MPIIAIAKGSGYSNTEWGMNPKQVISVEKNKVKIIEPREYSTGWAKAENNEIKIDGSSYTATFVFDEKDALVATYLTSNTKDNIGIANLEFNTLEKLLNQKYGKPLYKSGDTVTWKTNSTSIELKKLIFNRGAFAQAVVNYEPASKSTRDTSNL